MNKTKNLYIRLPIDDILHLTLFVRRKATVKQGKLESSYGIW